MSHTLLRNFIRHVLLEKIRSNIFKLNDFKSLSNLESMHEYASVLEGLGTGSGRWVYLLSSSKVLKLAALDAASRGIAQNKAEFDMAQDPSISNHVAAVLDHDPEFRWVIAELVRPLSNQNEFFSFIDMPESSKFDLSAAVEYSELDDRLREEYYPGLVLSDMAAQFVASLQALVAAGQSTGDMGHFGHWGKTNSGKLALLDYGLTRKVQDAHYTPDAMAAASIEHMKKLASAKPWFLGSQYLIKDISQIRSKILNLTMFQSDAKEYAKNPDITRESKPVGDIRLKPTIYSFLLRFGESEIFDVSIQEHYDTFFEIVKESKNAPDPDDRVYAKDAIMFADGKKILDSMKVYDLTPYLLARGFKAMYFTSGGGETKLAVFEPSKNLRLTGIMSAK